ncbi:M23 family metallopeptidase [Candidatus Sneabacter namystus]|uniref:M23 family metallopeptidase n=1 Tax=Candidatus Sneabacter namystus TaxID=2601646 RepID=A0A5C0UH24_9RICK|nr:M23 family metallopeptidase [Candidatus Sneabacter namystus]QEK39435.1 M23 family metallopeptidase [Candidatus Sneabacter namystus]
MLRILLLSFCVIKCLTGTVHATQVKRSEQNGIWFYKKSANTNNFAKNSIQAKVQYTQNKDNYHNKTAKKKSSGFIMPYIWKEDDPNVGNTKKLSPCKSETVPHAPKVKSATKKSSGFVMPYIWKEDDPKTSNNNAKQKEHSLNKTNVIFTKSTNNKRVYDNKLSSHSTQHTHNNDKNLTNARVKVKPYNSVKEIKKEHKFGYEENFCPNAAKAQPSKKTLLNLITKYGANDEKFENEIFGWKSLEKTTPKPQHCSQIKTQTNVLSNIDWKVRNCARVFFELHLKHNILTTKESDFVLNCIDSNSMSLNAALTRLEMLDKIASKIPILIPQKQTVITSHYGKRFVRRQGINNHTGIDMTSPNCIVYAAANGIVEFNGYAGAYGKNLVINHGTLKTRYAHLSRSIVHNGKYVKQGQPIGIEGKTGNARGRHLHFEIIDVGGNRVNPVDFICYSMDSTTKQQSAQMLVAQNARCTNKSKIMSKTFGKKFVKPKRTKAAFKSSKVSIAKNNKDKKFTISEIQNFGRMSRVISDNNSDHSFFR